MPSVIQLKTGTGSAVPSALAQGEVAINIDNGLFYYGSGSGEDVKQLESFTHITASGDISSSGQLYGGLFNSDTGIIIASQRVLYDSVGDNIKLEDSGLWVEGGHITASGNISASGTGTNYIGGAEIASGRVRVTDRVEHLGDSDTFITFNTDELVLRTGGTDRYTVNGNGHQFTGNITASGNISSSGNVTATQLRANGRIYTNYNLSEDHFLRNTTVNNPIVSAVGGFNVAGHLTASGDISASGDIIGGGLTFKDASIQFTAEEDNKIELDASGHKYNALDGDTMHYNEAGNNVDIKMESSAGVNLFSQGNAQKIGIGGTVDPPEALTVTGNISASGDVRASNIILKDDSKVGTFTGIENTDTYIQFDDTNTKITLKVDGDDTVQVKSGTVGIAGPPAFQMELTVAGDISASGDVIAVSGSFDHLNIGQFISRDGDPDTFINFTDDDINIQAGGVNMLDFTQGGANEITFNEEGVDIDVRMEGNTDQQLFHLNAGTDKVGIGTDSPSSKLQIDGDLTATHVTASGNVSASGIITTTIEGTGTTTGIETSGYLSSSALYVGNGSTFVSASTGNLQGSGNITGFTSMSISYITASIIDVDGDTIRMGGEPFTKSNIQALKLGRSLKPIKDGRNKPDVEGDQGIFESHITASGNISSSGNIIGDHFIGLNDVRLIENNSDTVTVGFQNNTPIQLGKNANPIKLEGNITASGNISSTGNISSSGTLSGQAGHLLYDTGSISATGNVQGDILRFGNVTTLAGAIYAHTGSGWVLAHSGSNGNASSSLALAVGTNSTNDGMLMRGMANIGYDPGGENGCALYLQAPGSASHVPATTSGHVARVVGWNFGTDTIYFNPDNTWVLVS